MACGLLFFFIPMWEGWQGGRDPWGPGREARALPCFLGFPIRRSSGGQLSLTPAPSLRDLSLLRHLPLPLKDPGNHVEWSWMLEMTLHLPGYK